MYAIDSNLCMKDEPIEERNSNGLPKSSSAKILPILWAWSSYYKYDKHCPVARYQIVESYKLTRNSFIQEESCL